MKRFQGADREQGMLMPYDLSEWLPEAHLARFVVDITDRLDFSKVYRHTRVKALLPMTPNYFYHYYFMAIRLEYSVQGK
jgi:hypothetical protein